MGLAIRNRDVEPLRDSAQDPRLIAHLLARGRCLLQLARVVAHDLEREHQRVDLPLVVLPPYFPAAQVLDGVEEGGGGARHEIRARPVQRRARGGTWSRSKFSEEKLFEGLQSIDGDAVREQRLEHVDVEQ